MSARFTFPLEAALRQRARQEQVAQVALAQTVTAYAAAVAGEDSLKRQRERAARQAESLPGRMGEPFSAPARMNALYFLDRGAASIRRQHGAVEQWEQEVRRQRALLVEAAQRRRALERLRERRKQAFDLTARRRLEGQLDELVTMRHGRAGLSEEIG